MRVILVALAASVATAQADRFAVAIVRLDGSLVPFAAYDAGKWQRAWPEADEALDIKPPPDNVPSVWRRRGERVPTVWQAWPASGSAAVKAQVKGVEVAEAHCQHQVVLKTDLAGAKAEHPRKLGIAIDTASVPVDAVEEVRRSDPEWATAEKVIPARFSELETAQAAKDRLPLPRETPAPVPQFTVLYRQVKSPGSPMYFIARKTYRTAPYPPDPKCTAHNRSATWRVAPRRPALLGQSGTRLRG